MQKGKKKKERKNRKNLNNKLKVIFKNNLIKFQKKNLKWKKSKTNVNK